MKKDNQAPAGPVCTRPDSNLSGVTLVELNPDVPLKDYLEAMELAKEEAFKHIEDFMLMSWYDRDRDFESPQHTTESDEESAVPGYVYYGVKGSAKNNLAFLGTICTYLPAILMIQNPQSSPLRLRF